MSPKNYWSNFGYWFALALTTLIIALIGVSLEYSILAYLFMGALLVSLIGAYFTYLYQRNQMLGKKLNKKPFLQFQEIGFVNYGGFLKGNIMGYDCYLGYGLDTGRMMNMVWYKITYDLNRSNQHSIIDKLNDMIHRYPAYYQWGENGVEKRLLIPFKYPSYEKLYSDITDTINIIKLNHIQPAANLTLKH